MSWDHDLLRKYNTTGHFRLINQVRNELKAQPLQRDPATRKLMLQVMPLRVAPAQPVKKNISIDNQIINEAAAIVNDDPQLSFRERLNAIEMR